MPAVWVTGGVAETRVWVTGAVAVLALAAGVAAVASAWVAGAAAAPTAELFAELEPSVAASDGAVGASVCVAGVVVDEMVGADEGSVLVVGVVETSTAGAGARTDLGALDELVWGFVADTETGEGLEGAGAALDEGWVADALGVVVADVVGFVAGGGTRVVVADPVIVLAVPATSDVMDGWRGANAEGASSMRPQRQEESQSRHGRDKENPEPAGKARSTKRSPSRLAENPPVLAPSCPVCSALE